jgi:hypothetical protein
MGPRQNNGKCTKTLQVSFLHEQYSETVFRFSYLHAAQLVSLQKNMIVNWSVLKKQVQLFYNDLCLIHV